MNAYLQLFVAVFGVALTVFVLGTAKHIYFNGFRRRRTEWEVSMPERIEDDVYVLSIDDLEEGNTSAGPSKTIEVTPELVDDCLKNLSWGEPEKWADGEELCSICLDEFSEKVESGDIFIAPKCEHAYHLKCISKWVFTRGVIDCPICKQEFISGQEEGSAFQKLARRRSLLQEDPKGTVAEPSLASIETNPATTVSV
uniref:RING-type domain-containing protein n=1 Tax=Rhodosorus marinus TaxID=101924 RepID=A0A7S0BPT2_9RHOD|mmetsp:Transcript_3763/g.5337  ORF Transcript_3763/g.5337 Transcript_3763/m.5337 type:complete len:198 (+) Transcript_3763:411-1004(+)|eukprot:CAMPEP_0184753080 /NCGR_PEP_ID=MMETSP0315-20130426/43917_1 /TAXON_ID=101924 /ORGANISM="Rhodosorus marinus, Strain UTEX LB 2760" /LENGTH=197 /DNA_ID=CAMNT_0027232445 /DNA_START=158 /DNA_END=751 /DNA_ORIENTATION=+